jgi:hypothetical protein
MAVVYADDLLKDAASFLIEDGGVIMPYILTTSVARVGGPPQQWPEILITAPEIMRIMTKFAVWLVNHDRAILLLESHK